MSDLNEAIRHIQEDDIFKSASEEEAKTRKADYRKALLAGPKVPVYIEIRDQGEISYAKAGEFWYDDNDEVYIAEDGKEYEKQDLEEMLSKEESGSSFWPTGIRIVDRDELEWLLDNIQKVLKESKIREADVFQPAGEEELAKRKQVRDAVKKAKIEEWEAQHNRKIDTCRHCGADLRNDDIGVYSDETEYNTVYWRYDANTEYWDVHDTDHGDAETTAYYCGKCNKEIKRYRDFDIDLDESVNEKDIFQPASAKEVAKRMKKMIFRRYYFPLTLSGVGYDIDEAWEDATESFGMDPGSSPTEGITAERLDPETYEEIGPEEKIT